jgi:glycosyltransferase involved in cell wall biosynthesis
MTPLISAAICTYQRYDLLKQAIDSLERQNLDKSQYEILVIDNSPDWQFSENFAIDYASIENLRWVIERTAGLSNARNVATDLATAPIIAFMDDDAIARPGWLAAILAAYERFGDEAGAVGGKVNPIWEAPRPGWMHDDLLGLVSVIDRGSEVRALTDNEWLAGVNISFRVDLLKETGGFNVSLGRKGGSHALLSNEEVDIVEKIKERGYVVVYSPDAEVDHMVEVDRLSQTWVRRRVAWQAVSDYLKDPATAFQNAPRHWHTVYDFVNRLSPKNRSPRAFFTEIDDADLFKMQMAALYNYTTLMLTGFNGLEEE